MLVSGGVGEDVSFDVEFVSKHQGKAILFDPTPRAIQHINEVYCRFGLTSEVAYSSTGNQPSASYDLASISSDNFIFYKFALLNEPKIVKFYAPPAKDHVSYSIQNIQNRFNPKGAFIEVEAIGPNEVRNFVPNSSITVLKLDIEGSEYQFLHSCFMSNIFPNQILVEIDELHFPSIQSWKIAKKLFRLLRKNGYILFHRDGYNFSYIRLTLS